MNVRPDRATRVPAYSTDSELPEFAPLGPAYEARSPWLEVGNALAVDLQMWARIPLPTVNDIRRKDHRESIA